MTVDTRRFEYPLEPLLRQRQWQRDAVTAELGRVQRMLEVRQCELANLRDRLRLESERVAFLLVSRCEPAGHRRSLGWLLRVRKLIQKVELHLQGLRTERERARAACVAAEQRVEVIERHRAECLEEFARDEVARLATEADRDWLMRQGTPEAVQAGEGT